MVKTGRLDAASDPRLTIEIANCEQWSGAGEGEAAGSMGVRARNPHRPSPNADRAEIPATAGVLITP